MAIIGGPRAKVRAHKAGVGSGSSTATIQQQKTIATAIEER
jgi:hypothetical protein